MKYILLGLLFILSACGSSNSIRKKIDRPGTHISSGIEKYLMSSFPDWLNFSEAGACKRDFIPRYIDISKINKDYRLSYVQSVNLQGLFNKNFLIKKAGDVDKVKLTEESYYFYTSYDEVKGGSKFFKPHEFNKVNVYWIDPAINNKAKLSKLISITKKKEFLDAPPVFISSCLSEKGIFKFLKKNVIDFSGAKAIDATMFSVFGSSFKHNQKFVLDVEKIFSDKEVTVYSTDEKVKDILLGKYKFIKF